MKINELIRAVTKDYVPIKKKVIESQKNGTELSETDERLYFELNTTLELYKVLKGVFMEEVTKNKKMTQDLIKQGVLHSYTANAEKDGKSVNVEVVSESMDERIDLVPEDIQMSILEKMVKSHKENITTLKQRKEWKALQQEEFELKVIEQFLPKEATKEDIMSYLDEKYPSGVDQKMMGKVIGEVKKSFARADGKMISECVKSKLV